MYVVMVMRVLTLPTVSYEFVYEWVVFGGFFIVCIVWEYVMIVGEFNELYGLCWGWS